MKFRSTKTYGHELGLSACFRQWRAASHCAQLHGYALAFHFVFEAEELDENGWVVDFGGLKSLKDKLVDEFDHRTIVAKDDPQIDKFVELASLGILDLRIWSDGVGVERFARWGLETATEVLKHLQPRVTVVSCEVREHGANSALCLRGE